MPLTHKQPKKWWTNRQTNRQTKHSTPAAHARARGNDAAGARQALAWQPQLGCRHNGRLTNRSDTCHSLANFSITADHAQTVRACFVASNPPPSSPPQLTPSKNGRWEEGRYDEGAWGGAYQADEAVCRVGGGDSVAAEGQWGGQTDTVDGTGGKVKGEQHKYSHVTLTCTPSHAHPHYTSHAHPHMHTLLHLTCTPSYTSHAHLHMHTLTTPHMHTLTCTPSHAHLRMHTLTCYPHMHTLTCTLTCDPHMHPHIHTLTYTPSHAHPHTPTGYWGEEPAEAGAGRPPVRERRTVWGESATPDSPPGTVLCTH